MNRDERLRMGHLISGFKMEFPPPGKPPIYPHISRGYHKYTDAIFLGHLEDGHYDLYWWKYLFRIPEVPIDNIICKFDSFDDCFNIFDLNSIHLPAHRIRLANHNWYAVAFHWAKKLKLYTGPLR